MDKAQDAIEGWNQFMKCLICGTLYQPRTHLVKAFFIRIGFFYLQEMFQQILKSQSRSIDFTDFLGTLMKEQSTQSFVLYTYNEAMKEYLHQYKFLQDVALAKVFSGKLQQAFQKTEGIVVPIPMHPEKLKYYAHLPKWTSYLKVPHKFLFNTYLPKQHPNQGKKQKKND